MDCLIWSFGSTSLSVSKSNFEKSFSKDSGKGCGAPGMERASIVRHNWFASMLHLILMFGQGYGIQFTVGFVSGGSRGPKQPT